MAKETVQINTKARALLWVLAIYVLAFIVGYVCCIPINQFMLKVFVFDTVATIVTFIFSVILKNSSVYDAYWSFTPMLMSVWIFLAGKAFAPMQILFLVIFNIWSVRLTLNWVEVFTDFSYEDWRYIKFRNETPKIFWPIVNFFGIHYMPTLVVFAGMLPLFALTKMEMGVYCIPGMIVMLMGISFEFFADRQMHAFLQISRSKKGEKTQQKDGFRSDVCRVGLWNYSRHPNYLGEITFWVGVFLTMIPYAPNLWYYGIGAVSIGLLFNAVSIPLMEKRQLSRRPAYEEYRKVTARLLLGFREGEYANQSAGSIGANMLLAAGALFVNGLGVFMTFHAGLGAGPWDVLNLGLSKTLGILYGTASISVSLLILLIDIILKEPIGIAMFIDAFVVGKAVDFFEYTGVIPVPETMVGKVVMIVIGLVIMGYTQYLYMMAALGCGPRDTLLVGLKKRTKHIPIGVVSILILSTATLIGYLLGGPVGIGTLLCAFCSGPVMQFAFTTVKFDATGIRHQRLSESKNILLKRI